MNLDNRGTTDIIHVMRELARINPEDYILSVLSPEDRLEAAFEVVKRAFRNTALSLKDIEKAVKKVRRKVYETGTRQGCR